MNANLERRIGFHSATAVVVGEVIAVGIFLTPAGMARSLASPLWIGLVWVAMGGMAICGALCYGALTARFPQAGGGYVYLREAWGPRVAFLYGWKCFLVMDPGLTAALAVGMAGYVGYLLPLPSWGVPVVAIAAILLLAGVNVVGVRFGAAVTRTLAIAKVGLLAAIAIWGFGRGGGSWSHFVPFAERAAGSEPLIGALAGGLVGAFFSFGGWWDLTKLAGEVRDPERTVPRAVIAGVATVTGVYLLTTAVFIYLVPIASVTSGETFAAQAGEALFGAAGGRIFAGIVIVSVLGSLAALLMVAPRVYFAMARDGLFPHAVAELHPRFDTPARAIGLQALLASLFAATGSFDEIVVFFIFVTIFFIGLTVLGGFRVARRDGGKWPRAAAIAFLGMTLVLLVLIAVGSPGRAALGTVVVLAGIPVYQVLLRRR
ncbi:MAG TPA: amino acid permease [Blastocatellia bacterium]|nr:amino acid permease [Blastocatellia bacterium]